MDDGQPLPGGQTLRDQLKVKHYGPVPRADPATWSMMFTAEDPTRASALGHELGRVTVQELAAWEQTEVSADLHCASGWSVQRLGWRGVPAAALLDRFPPPPGTVGVMVYAEYGYSANVRLDDLRRPGTMVATHLNGKPLEPEHGFPVRLVVPHLYAYKSPKWFRGWEYLTTPRRGFWEERGYHLIGDPWPEQRYSYQE